MEVRLAGAAVSALLGEARPDIARSFPEVPGSRTAGFLAEIDTTGVPDGLHFLSIRAAKLQRQRARVAGPGPHRSRVGLR